MSHSEEELRMLLEKVSDKGLKALDLTEMERLSALLKAKDYGENKNANKSKAKLLKHINTMFYDRNKPRGSF